MRTIVDERLGLLYSRARRYRRGTRLRRENRGKILESKRGTKARLGWWTKRDEDDEKRRGLRLTGDEYLFTDQVNVD